MKYPIYAVRDVQVGFNSPMTDISDNVAKRNFAYAINNPNNGVMNFEPKDYDLYRIGEFDTDKGTISAYGVPELVCTGISVYGADLKGVESNE